jgi:hypothetical protein
VLFIILKAGFLSTMRTAVGILLRTRKGRGYGMRRTINFLILPNSPVELSISSCGLCVGVALVSVPDAYNSGI